MDVATFDEVRTEFDRRVSRIVWCTVATVDRRGRPRTRILHPIWEGTTGWIATGRHTLKTKHLANNPYVSITYWDPEHEQVYIEATAEWDDDIGQKRRVWDLFKNTPPPLGYDPGIIWEGPEDKGFGLLRLSPSRIELFGLAGLAANKRQIWRA